MTETPYSNKRPAPKSKRNITWLKEKKVSIDVDLNRGEPVPLKLILGQLSAAGVNIATTIPLDTYNYSGYPIARGTDAYTALEILTASVGLDFRVQETAGSRYVQVIEMGTSHFSLVVPDVKVALQLISGGDSEDGKGDSGNGQSKSDTPTAANQLGSTSSVDNSVTYENEFWKTLENELRAQMTILVPVSEEEDSSVNAQPVPMDLYPTGGVAPGISNGTDPKPFKGYEEVTIGKVSVNSTTGQISITAPKHVRERLVKYLENIDSVINTRIQVEAKVVSVTRRNQETRGIDLAGIKALGSDWGLMVGNDTFGNTTISMPSATSPFDVSAVGALSGSMIGIGKDNGRFQAFIDYMSSVGDTQSVSDLSTSVRSGRSASLSEISNEPRINSSSQSTTTDGGTTSGGTENTITNYETGTVMHVTPVYDPKRGVVHSIINAQITLDVGESKQAEPLIAGDEIKIIERVLKNTRVMTVQTESLSKNGELVIIGGFTTTEYEDSNSGITWLKDTALGGLFGKSDRKIVKTDYFIVLETRAVPYERMH